MIILSFLVVILGHFKCRTDDPTSEESDVTNKGHKVSPCEHVEKSSNRAESMMSTVKKARQKAIRDAVERDMTEEERDRENKAANEMLAKVYSVMKENEEVFGTTSFDDVKSQMELYKEL